MRPKRAPVLGELLLGGEIADAASPVQSLIDEAARQVRASPTWRLTAPVPVGFAWRAKVFWAGSSTAQADTRETSQAVVSASDEWGGYTVAYEQEEAQFPVYVVAAIGGLLIACGAGIDNIALVAIGLAALGFAYHNVPLLETGRPRIGAGQYGVFIEGLGIIAWRGIEEISVHNVPVRGLDGHDLHIALADPLEKALIADWRARPWWRYLMRLPYTMPNPGMVRIPLDVMDKPADEIARAFQRMMGFYRR